MTSIILTYSENVAGDVATSFEATARKFLPIEGPVRNYVRLSAQELPAVIRLIGSVAAWLSLATATGYFGQLGVKAADFTLEKAKSAFKRKRNDALSEIAIALSEAKRGLGSNSHIIIGLNIPDDHFGTSIMIESSEPDAISYEIGKFLVNAEKIATLMQKEIAAGRGPLGRASVTFELNGSVKLRWMCQSDMTIIERDL